MERYAEGLHELLDVDGAGFLYFLARDDLHRNGRLSFRAPDARAGDLDALDLLRERESWDCGK